MEQVYYVGIIVSLMDVRESWKQHTSCIDAYHSLLVFSKIVLTQQKLCNYHLQCIRKSDLVGKMKGDE